MKTTIITASLIAAATLPLLPAGAIDVAPPDPGSPFGSATPLDPFGSATPPSPVWVAEQEIDAAIKKLERSTQKGEPNEQDFDDARSAVDIWGDAASLEGPGVCTLRERLHRRIDNLEGLAFRYALHMEDVVELQSLAIDSKLDRYLAVIHERALQGGVDRESFTEVVRLLNRRAELAKDDEFAVATRERLVGAVEGLMERTHDLVEGIREVRMEFIQTRLQEAMTKLQKRACSGEATRSAYQSVADLCEDRARALAGEVFPSCP